MSNNIPSGLGGEERAQADVQALDVPLAAIIADGALQPRLGGLDSDHVRALEETPEQWPPLSLVEQASGYLLIDGFHRLAAAQNLGLERVRARVLAAPEDGDLRSLAFALNAAHGRPLSLADRRAEAERLLVRDSRVSNMEVSRRCALSPTTVQAIRRRLEEDETIAPSERRLGRDGTSYSPTPRQPGVLPDTGLGEVVGDAVGRLFSSAERVAQRKVARYLERLATALEDQDALQVWSRPEEVAEACQAVLGPERAAALAERLGRTSTSVYSVSVALGYAGAEAQAE